MRYKRANMRNENMPSPTYNHLILRCPTIKKTAEMVVRRHASENSEADTLANYTSIGKVSGYGMKILRVTIQIWTTFAINMLVGEVVWLRTPCEQNSICPSLAETELKCEIDHIITPDAVLTD
ncbi:hypothetical protein TNIN_230031 [Trichonephila inaurata madagascariensis]|uniref:Uncharacterized protein n=1 Tax=Trichonephila inaurata madagascariensis TaxID=2747483 RepID=A0A8X6XUP2_9ARAC|nr:hypothetical protein TNIN_230031 [Trichonephila inaurata madagascariensis]